MRELSEVWVDETHKPLPASKRYALADLEELHGYEKVKSAIEQIAGKRYYPTFADLEKTLRGGERNDNTAEYELPDTSKDPDLSKYL